HRFLLGLRSRRVGVHGWGGSSTAPIESRGSPEEKKKNDQDDKAWQTKAESKLAPLGGKATLRDRRDSGSQERMISFSFSGKVKDDNLAVLKDLVPFDTLVLDHTKITDAGLKHLEDLPSLRSLSLYDCVK